MTQHYTTEEAVETIATLVAADMVAKLGLDESDAQSFWPILIDLLIPILVDLLRDRCAPDNAEALRTIATAKGIRGRLFNWQYRNAVKRLVGNQDDYQAWGRQIGDSLLAVAVAPGNDTIVTAAMRATTAPIWGVFR